MTLDAALQACTRELRTQALEALAHGTPQPTAVLLDPPADAPSLRLVSLISVPARIRYLKNAIQETQALALVMVVDGYLRGFGEALLTVAVTRDGQGQASALPYRRGPLGLSFKPEQQSRQIFEHYHKQLFNP